MEQSNNPAAKAYNGYEYQIVASIWVALTLMIEQGIAMEVIVEPDSLEDLEATIPGELIVRDHISATVEVPLHGETRMLYQMKTRSFKTWTVSALKDVVGDGEPAPISRPGSAPRAKALELLLEDDSRLYTLITDARVAGELSAISRTALLKMRSESALPVGILAKGSDEKAQSLHGRVHIVDGYSEKLLGHLIDALLKQTAKVPYTNVEACFKELVQVFRDCLLQRRDKRVTVQNLRDIFSRFGARDPRGPIPGYVAPTKLSDALAMLQSGRRLLLVGPPDIGKASLAEFLTVTSELGALSCPVAVLSNISELSIRLSDDGPGLLVVKNGWDEEIFAEGRSPSDLPAILDRASADKYIIVTCDSSVYARLPRYMQSRLEQYKVTLELNDYSDEDRWQIVLNQAGLTDWQLKSLEEARIEILRDLHEPLFLYLLGTHIRNNAYKMREPLPQTDDLLSDFLGLSIDRNHGFFQELVERTIHETVGDRAARILEECLTEPFMHAALYLGLHQLTIPYEAQARVGGFPLMESIVNGVYAKTGVRLNYSRYVNYLVSKAVLQTHERGAWLSVEAAPLSALRSIVINSKREAYPVLVSILEELEKGMNRGNFAKQLQQIISLIHAFNPDDPIEDSTWIDVIGRIDAKVQQALQTERRELFVENFETIMEWRWGRSELSCLVCSLSPDGLPYIVLDDDLGFFGRKLNWQGPYGSSRLTLPCEFLRCFLVDFMPYTGIDYTQVQSRLVNFLRDSQEVSCTDVRAAIGALETNATTDFEDGRWDYQNPWLNLPVLVELGKAMGCGSYRPSVTAAKRDWEL